MAAVVVEALGTIMVVRGHSVATRIVSEIILPSTDTFSRSHRWLRPGGACRA